jgi:hypothetical protein
MTERERWIVYPLLFLALGAGLRDKLFDQTKSKVIECEKLRVLADGGDDRHSIQLPSGGAVVEGQLLVESIRAGTINADNYAFQGIPFVPTFTRVIPGGLGPGVVRRNNEASQIPNRDDKSAEPTTKKTN